MSWSVKLSIIWQEWDFLLKDSLEAEWWSDTTAVRWCIPNTMKISTLRGGIGKQWCQRPLENFILKPCISLMIWSTVMGIVARRDGVSAGPLLLLYSWFVVLKMYMTLRMMQEATRRKAILEISQAIVPKSPSHLKQREIMGSRTYQNSGGGGQLFLGCGSSYQFVCTHQLEVT